MEIKKKVDRDEQLLQARRTALDNASNQVLRPLGKLWGMDVFGWYNPAIGELAATISALPFPVFWLSNERTVLDLANLDPETLRMVKWVGQYDHPQITIPSDVLKYIPLCTGTETIAEALTFLQTLKEAKHVVLFTYFGNEWKTNYETFEAFVKLHQ